jgi:hypothetical protein
VECPRKKGNKWFDEQFGRDIQQMGIKNFHRGHPSWGRWSVSLSQGAEKIHRHNHIERFEGKML